MLRFPVSYRGYTFNGHLDPSGNLLPALAEDTTTIDAVASSPTFRDLREPFHLVQGGSLGPIHKGLRYLRLSGRIIVPRDTTEAVAGAKLTDKEFALRAALDPYLADLASPSTDGASPLDWKDWTEAAGFAPIISLRYYARPTTQPSIEARLADRRSRTWAAILACPDPRAYFPTERSLTLTQASPSGNATNAGTTPAPLKATISLAGAGATNFTITVAGRQFVLNLSGLGATTVSVLFEAYSGPYGRGRRILVGGTEAPSRRVSDPGSWLSLPVGTSACSMTNHTNVTSCVLSWYDAWA